MSWFDIGVNLTDKRMELNAVVERARLASVNHILITGSNVEQSDEAAKIASQLPQMLASTAGIHPHYAAEATADYIQQLTRIALQTEVVAIGECGLDFNRNFSPRDVQLEVFEAQLQLACELKKPVFLHERDAFEQQILLLRKYRPQLVGGVAHCFTGNEAQMRAYLDLDLYIGVTGWLCDVKRGEALRQAVKKLPLERVLLETDAPYLLPKTLEKSEKKFTHGNNEPYHLPHIAEHLAPLMDVSVEQLEQHSCLNACNLFLQTPAKLTHEL